MRYIIGCDIGTTSVKAVAFTLVGDILGSESASYPMVHPEPGYAEQDPMRILDGTLEVLKRLITHLDSSPIGVVFSSAMHSLMALDRSGNPISPLIIWADNRSGHLAEAFRKTEAGRDQYRRTGIPIHAMTPACKLLWVNQQKAGPLFNAPYYVGIKDFVILRLTGQLVTDYSMAAATGLLNLEHLQWDEATLSSLDVSTQQLPQVVSPYHQALVMDGPGQDFMRGVPIVVGGSDGCLANLGSGASGADTLALTIGTSGAVRKTVTKRHLDRQMRTFCYPLDDEIFIVGGPTNNGGVVFQWVKDTFFADLSFEEMVEGAATVAPGSDGLLFFPYLLGERAPLWDSDVRGCFQGIDIVHTRFHFARAAMEGILMNLYVIAHPLLETGPVRTIYANGGFAQSMRFVQMLADVFGADVALNSTNDAGCIGAALMGLKSLGEIADFASGGHFVRISEVVKYNPEVHHSYKHVFENFRKSLETISLQQQRGA